MEVVRNVLLWCFVSVVFVSVLLADFMPLALGDYAPQRFLLVVILASVVSVAAAAMVRRDALVALKVTWPAVVVASGFILLSLPYSNALYGWVEPGMYAAFFLGFTFAGCLLRRSGQTTRCVVALVYVGAATVAFYGAATITVYLFAFSDQLAKLSNFIPWGFVNIRYWSHIATWLIPLLPLAVLIGPFQDQRMWRFFTALGAALWWWIIFLSASRGTMVGLAFGVVVSVLFIGRPAMPWLKVFLRYLAYGGLVWLLLSVVIPALLLDEMSTRTLSADSSGRMPLFIEAWRMSLENFPFGMGPQSWLTHEVLTDEYRHSSKFGHPHNMYLMWAAEYGWILIGAIFAQIVQALRLLWQRRDKVYSVAGSSQALPLAAFSASVSAALLHAGVSAVFIAPGSMLIGFLVLCVFWALILPEMLPDRSKHPKIGVLVAAIVGLLVSCLSYFWLKEVTVYHNAMQSDLEFYYDNVPAGTLPRFWFHGNFPRSPDQMAH